ncbi:MAG: 6,7-dimethyl-8-ribityllumazine synthase [Gemmatimonadales bacterium]
MPDFSGALRHHQRVVILVSRYHERVTTRLLDGARQCCREAGIPDDQVDVVWVPGAWELGTMAALMAGDGVSCIIALGAVIRGETPHFDFVAGETSRVLADVAARQMIPVGFGLLTTETLDQALARAGGAAGNKGYEAAEAAIRTADLYAQLLDDDA